MESVRCPYCEQKIYSAYWSEGEERCIYCGKKFSIFWDESSQRMVPEKAGE